jgi:hypothetical protein
LPFDLGNDNDEDEDDDDCNEEPFLATQLGGGLGGLLLECSKLQSAEEVVMILHED